jgi:hypothetical protein
MASADFPYALLFASLGSSPECNEPNSRRLRYTSYLLSITSSARTSRVGGPVHRSEKSVQ